MIDVIGQKRLCIFLEEYYEFLVLMEQTQQQKIAALATNRLEDIQKTISAQQAEIMNLANMEEKRMRLQREIGMADFTFKEIIEASDLTLRGSFQELFVHIEGCLAQIKFLNDKASTFLRSKLGEHGAEVENYGYNSHRSHMGEQPPVLLKTKI